MARRARRRRIWADDEKRMICRQSRLPGVSVSQVARRYDVNANLVFNWLRDARFAPGDVEPPIEALAVGSDATLDAKRTSDGARPPAFLPVELIAEAAEAPSPDISPEPVAGAAPPGSLEIALVGGHRLRIVGTYDPEALARLVRALSEPGP